MAILVANLNETPTDLIPSMAIVVTDLIPWTATMATDLIATPTDLIPVMANLVVDLTPTTVTFLIPTIADLIPVTIAMVTRKKILIVSQIDWIAAIISMITLIVKMMKKVIMVRPTTSCSSSSTAARLEITNEAVKAPPTKIIFLIMSIKGWKKRTSMAIAMMEAAMRMMMIAIIVVLIDGNFLCCVFVERKLTEATQIVRDRKLWAFCCVEKWKWFLQKDVLSDRRVCFDRRCTNKSDRRENWNVSFQYWSYRIHRRSRMFDSVGDHPI